MSGEATLSAAWTRIGNLSLTSFESTTSLSVVAAPMVSPSEDALMPMRSLMVVRSMRTSGYGRPLPLTQSFIRPPTRSLPPPTTFTLRLACAFSRSTASLTDPASYSSKALIAFLLSVRRLDRREQLVASERHLRHPRADRVVHRVHDRRCRWAHRRLAQAVRSEDTVGLGLPVDRAALELLHVGELRLGRGSRLQEERAVDHVDVGRGDIERLVLLLRVIDELARGP